MSGRRCPLFTYFYFILKLLCMCVRVYVCTCVCKMVPLGAGVTCEPLNTDAGVQAPILTIEQPILFNR